MLECRLKPAAPIRSVCIWPPSITRWRATPYTAPTTASPACTGSVCTPKTLGFVHPITGEYLRFDSDLPDYFTHFLATLRREESMNHLLPTSWSSVIWTTSSWPGWQPDPGGAGCAAAVVQPRRPFHRLFPAHAQGSAVHSGQCASQAPALVCGGTMAYHFADGSRQPLCTFAGQDAGLFASLPSGGGCGHCPADDGRLPPACCA